MNTIALDQEQQRAVSSTAHRLLIQAPPGAGKTAILHAIAKENAHCRMLYLTFSRAMADQAKNRLPANVQCMTFHAMTYRALRAEYGHKFQKSEVRPSDIVKLFDIPREQSAIAALALDTVNRFLHSKQDIPVARNLPPVSAEYTAQDNQKIIQLARRIWARMQDTNDPMPISHDSGAKIFQTRMYSIEQDLILYDEAQDSDAVIIQTLEQQNCRIIAVGDPYQSIYDYRGSAVNFHDDFNSNEQITLKRSYRFGQYIAEAATAIINQHGNPGTEIIGMSRDTSLVIPRDIIDLADIPFQVTHLFRTNAGLIEYVDAHLRKHPNEKICLIGGVNAYNSYDLLQIYHLAIGDRRWVNDPQLLPFNTLSELEEHAKNHQALDILSRIRLIRRHGKDLPQLIRNIAAACTNDPTKAGLHAGNVHKAKGMEFDCVSLAEDFSPIVQNGEINIGERNVMYVAATRAKKILLMNENLEDIYL